MHKVEMNVTFISAETGKEWGGEWSPAKYYESPADAFAKLRARDRKHTMFFDGYSLDFAGTETTGVFTRTEFRAA